MFMRIAVGIFVDQRSAKPSFPGPNPGGTSKRQSTNVGCCFLLLEECVMRAAKKKRISPELY